MSDLLKSAMGYFNTSPIITSENDFVGQIGAVKLRVKHVIAEELLRRVENEEAESAKELALIMFRTATLRSGFTLQESADFADSVEKLVRQTLGIPEDEKVEEEDIPTEDEAAEDKSEENGSAEDAEGANEEHDEL